MVGPNFYIRKNLVKKGLIYEIKPIGQTLLVDDPPHWIWKGFHGPCQRGSHAIMLRGPSMDRCRTSWEVPNNLASSLGLSGSTELRSWQNWILWSYGWKYIVSPDSTWRYSQCLLDRQGTVYTNDQEECLFSSGATNLVWMKEAIPFHCIMYCIASLSDGTRIALQYISTGPGSRKDLSRRLESRIGRSLYATSQWPGRQSNRTRTEVSTRHGQK